MTGASRRAFLGSCVVTAGGLAGCLESVRGSGSSTESWPMFQFDPANTGHGKTTGPKDGVTVDWKFDTGTERWNRVVSSPAVADGTLYVGSVEGRRGGVYALSPDGTQRWRFETNGTVESSPAVVDGTVYIGSSSFSVHALDAGDGTERWETRTQDRVEAPPAVADGRVFVGSVDRELYALDAGDGSVLWRTEILTLSSVALVDDRVFAATMGGDAVALDVDDGNVLWRTDIVDGGIWGPSVVDGSIYLGGHDGNVYALNADDGTERWWFETGDFVFSSPAVAEDAVFAGSKDGNVYAVDADDGTERWRFETDNIVRTAPAVVDGAVYVGSRDGNVYNNRAVISVWRLIGVSMAETCQMYQCAEVSQPAPSGRRSTINRALDVFGDGIRSRACNDSYVRLVQYACRRGCGRGRTR